MEPQLANDIINEYAANRGFPTIAEMNPMSRSDFTRELNLWATEYIATLPDAGRYYKLAYEIPHPLTGNIVQTEWG